MQHYLGMYDVSCHSARASVFRILSAYGIHQQKSVFECVLSAHAKNELLEQLSLVPSLYHKRLFLVRIYTKHQHSILLGSAKRMPKSGCLYVG